MSETKITFVVNRDITLKKGKKYVIVRDKFLDADIYEQV